MAIKIIYLFLLKNHLTTFSSSIRLWKKKDRALLLGSDFTSFIINNMEKTKNMSFWQVVKRFFEPVDWNRWFLIRPFLRSVWWASFTIYTVEIFKYSTKLIQVWDFQNLITNISIFSWILLIYVIVNYLLRDIGWATMEYEWLKFFQRMYMKRYFRLSNTEIEKIWTWKLIDILMTGFKTRNKMFQDIVGIIPAIIITWTYSFLQIRKAWWITFLVIFFLVIVLVFWVNKMNKKAIESRKKRTDLVWDYSRQFVKMLMNKMEILQNNRINQELEKTENILTATTTINKKTNFYLRAMFEPTRRLSHILKISILLYGWYTVSSLNTQFSQFVWLIAIVSIFETEMNRFLEYYKDFTNNFLQIERIRNVFDRTPQIEDEKNEHKNHFTYKSWNIKIQNMSFSYEDTVGSDFWSDRDFWSDQNGNAKNENAKNGNAKNGNAKNGNAKSISLQSNKKYVFHNFNLEIKGWTKTAFVGESWWGKTTLIKLLAGYIRPDNGEIEIDGQKLFSRDAINRISTEPINRISTDTISLQSYYKHIGYLTQEPSVFDGTIWENLAYGLENSWELDQIIPENWKNFVQLCGKTLWNFVSQKKDPLTSPKFPQDGLRSGWQNSDSEWWNHLQNKINEIIKLSKCEFIYDFPKWLQTEIGERWVRLSWWQKQRLAIAKIMLKNPDIIFLDEPTSALDSFNEELVSEALNNLFKNKTVIVVAHRLQTVKQADRICYIAREQVVNSKEVCSFVQTAKILEEWTHDELVQLNWKYKKMLDLQSGF